MFERVVSIPFRSAGLRAPSAFAVASAFATACGLAASGKPEGDSPIEADRGRGAKGRPLLPSPSRSRLTRPTIPQPASGNTPLAARRPAASGAA